MDCEQLQSSAYCCSSSLSLSSAFSQHSISIRLFFFFAFLCISCLSCFSLLLWLLRCCCCFCCSNAVYSVMSCAIYNVLLITKCGNSLPMFTCSIVLIQLLSFVSFATKVGFISGCFCCWCYIFFHHHHCYRRRFRHRHWDAIRNHMQKTNVKATDPFRPFSSLLLSLSFLMQYHLNEKISFLYKHGLMWIEANRGLECEQQQQQQQRQR